MRPLVLLVFLATFSSCGSNIIVEPGSKNFSGVWSKVNAKTRDFSVTRKLKSPLGIFRETKVSLHDVLNEEGVLAGDVSEISVEIIKTPLDGLLSCIPFFNRSTLMISGNYKKYIKDDLVPKDGAQN